MTDCLFCRIIQGDIPSTKIYEDEDVYAFLDLSQVTPGHTLVIPKQHVSDIFEYDQELAAKVFSRIPKIARAIEKGLPGVKGLNILNNNREVAYQSVFHSHIHLIPRYQEDEGFGLKFVNHADQYQAEDLQDIARSIAEQIED
ncbi:HIT family protein [Facklamia hominis]|uniref:HIT family protein n=1 Tax=Facklamia hominis TaxID=178214 RepID=UPI000C7C9A2E|nr:HIT family protein [Facklamia hominis]PKY92337.1 HIT family protein [Facklamia hominis]